MRTARAALPKGARRKRKPAAGMLREKKAPAGWFGRIKFSHLFSAILNVFVISLVIYTVSCTKSKWFTFSYSLPQSREVYDVGTLEICGGEGCLNIADADEFVNGKVKGVSFSTLDQAGKAALSLSVIGLFLSIVKLAFICVRIHPVTRAEKVMLCTDLAIILTVFSSVVLAAAPISFDLIIDNVMRDAYVIQGKGVGAIEATGGNDVASLGRVVPAEATTPHSPPTDPTPIGETHERTGQSGAVNRDDGKTWRKGLHVSREPDFAFVAAVVACVAEFTVGICLFLGRFIERDFGGQMYWKTARLFNRRGGQNQKRTLYLNPDDYAFDYEDDQLLSAGPQPVSARFLRSDLLGHPGERKRSLTMDERGHARV